MLMYTCTFLVASLALAGAFVPWPLSLHQRRDVRCGQRDMRACFRPLVNMQHPTTGLKLETIDTNQTLNYLCGKLDDAVVCLRDAVGNCQSLRVDNRTKVMMDTVKGVVEYVCSVDGRNALLSSKECWENERLEQSLQGCADDMESNVMADIPICSAITVFRNCSTEATRELCDSDTAATFVNRILYYAIKPSVDQFLDCKTPMRLTRDLLKMMKLRGNQRRELQAVSHD